MGSASPLLLANGRALTGPLDGYLRYCGCFYRAPVELVHQRVELHASRDRVWISWRGHEVAGYPRSYRPGCWIPEPVMRPEPPPPLVREIPLTVIEAPELADYAELCA